MIINNSDYFKGKMREIKNKKSDMILYLNLKGLNKLEISKLCMYFDFFVVNSEMFRPSILSNYSEDIPGLDISFMEKEFKYLNINWSDQDFIESIKEKLVADYLYGKRNLSLGKGNISSFLKSFLSIISTPFYFIVILCRLF